MNAKREKFCMEYVKDFNGTKAAGRAGYSKATADRQASRLLRNVDVLKRTEKIKAAATRRAEITLDCILEELGKIAFSNIGDYVSFSKSGVKLHNSSELTRDKTACIAEVSQKSKIVRFKLHDKVKALAALLDYFNSNPGDQDVKKTIKLPIAITLTAKKY